MSLLEQDITKKGQVDENATKLDAGDNESGKYEVKAIGIARSMLKIQN